MKLHRDLGITQKSAWHMSHRVRECWNDASERFTGEMEVDETYIGGKEANKHEDRKLRAGPGIVGKTAVVGVRDRATGRVNTEVVESTGKPTLQNFVVRHTIHSTTVYTDEASAYVGLPRRHETVKHSVKEYVNDQAHTNGIESHWAMLKRGYIGVYHKMSPKHLGRYVGEFEGRHNARALDTDEQISIMAASAASAASAAGKRLTYAALICSNDTRQPRML